MKYQIERDCALQAWEINTISTDGTIERQIQILDTELDALFDEICTNYAWRLSSMTHCKELNNESI